MKRALQIGALVAALTLGSPVLAQERNKYEESVEYNCKSLVDLLMPYIDEASKRGRETYTMYLYTEAARNLTDAEMECIKSGIREKSNGRYSADISIKDDTYKIDIKINKQD